jgi:hypothetical protein
MTDVQIASQVGLVQSMAEAVAGMSRRVGVGNRAAHQTFRLRHLGQELGTGYQVQRGSGQQSDECSPSLTYGTHQEIDT